jgi:hypothetical protein
MLAVASLAVSAVVQITQQVFFAPPLHSPYGDCRAGLRALYASIGHGLDATRKHRIRQQPDDEALLRSFRRSLQSTWIHREAVATSCRSEPKLLGVLDSIERLRYSEEHGVRHQAAELFATRAKARKLVAKHLGI